MYIDKFDTLDENLKEALIADMEVWAPGIEIISIRVTKPRIPKNIRANYEQMEAKKTELMIVTQEQKVVEKNAETIRKRLNIEAQSKAEVSKINSEKEIKEMESK